MKRKVIWAYLDGRRLVEVIRAASDNHVMIADMKKILTESYPGREVTFKVEYED